MGIFHVGIFKRKVNEREKVFYEENDERKITKQLNVKIKL